VLKRRSVNTLAYLHELLRHTGHTRAVDHISMQLPKVLLMLTPLSCAAFMPP